MGKYKRLISNTAILGVGTFASKVLVFLLMPLYTLLLSTEEFGISDLIVQTANLIIPLASVGICDGLFRFAIDSEKDDRKRVFTVSITVLTGGALLLAAIGGGVYAFGGIGVYAPLVVIYVICANFHSAVAHYLRAKGQTALFAMQGIVNTALTIALNILFLVVFRMGSTGYVLSVVIADLLITVGLFVGCRLWRDFSFRFFDRKMLRDLLKFSIPYIPTTMLWLITAVSDRYVVTLFCGADVQGLYAAAAKIPTLILLVSGVFIEAWQFSTVKDALPEERAEFFGTVYRNYMSIMFIAASVLIVGSKMLTKILMADSYYSSWEFVPILVIAMIFSSFSSFFGSVYFMEKKSVLSMLTALCGAVVNVILNFLLIPRHGAMGAAVATLISYLATYAVRSYDTVHYLKFKQYHARVILNTLLLLGQAIITISEMKYYWAVQAVILLIIFVVNGQELVEALLSIAKKLFSKKRKNI